MKLNIAFQTLLVATSAPSRAACSSTSYFRDPRTVEKKEPVQRRTMGDFQLPTMLETVVDGKSCEDRLAEAVGVNPTEKERSLACSAVSKDHSDCLGCQSFSQVVRYYIVLPCRILINIRFLSNYALTLCVILYR